MACWGIEVTGLQTVRVVDGAQGPMPSVETAETIKHPNKD
jgi:hypothetical protein